MGELRNIWRGICIAVYMTPVLTVSLWDAYVRKKHKSAQDDSPA